MKKKHLKISGFNDPLLIFTKGGMCLLIGRDVFTKRKCLLRVLAKYFVEAKKVEFFDEWFILKNQQKIILQTTKFLKLPSILMTNIWSFLDLFQIPDTLRTFFFRYFLWILWIRIRIFEFCQIKKFLFKNKCKNFLFCFYSHLPTIL